MSLPTSWVKQQFFLPQKITTVIQRGNTTSILSNSFALGAIRVTVTHKITIKLLTKTSENKIKINQIESKMNLSSTGKINLILIYLG